MAYWWAIGTIGTSTPASRPISWANMPPALTTTSHSMRAGPAAVATSTWVTRRRSDRSLTVATPMPVTLVPVAISTPAARAPAARAIVRSLGLSQPSVGSHTAPRTPAGSNHPWNSAAASVVDTSSSGSPNVLAHPACRRNSSSRSGVEARRSDPTSCQPGSWPVSACRAPVQLGPVHHHRRERDRPAELADEPGGVERRATRELIALDEQDVGPTELGEVVGDGCAADPAADDHHTGPVAHRRDTTQRRRATSRRRGRRSTARRWRGARRAYASKSVSNVEIARCTVAHIPSRSSLITFISCRRARWRGAGGAPR